MLLRAPGWVGGGGGGGGPSGAFSAVLRGSLGGCLPGWAGEGLGRPCGWRAAFSARGRGRRGETPPSLFALDSFLSHVGLGGCSLQGVGKKSPVAASLPLLYLATDTLLPSPVCQGGGASPNPLSTCSLSHPCVGEPACLRVCLRHNPPSSSSSPLALHLPRDSCSPVSGRCFHLEASDFYLAQ